MGHDEQPLSAVGRSGIGSAQTAPRDSKPQRGQVTDDAAEDTPASGSKQAWDVLNENVSGSKFPHDSKHLRPQIAFVRSSTALASHAERLAGRPTADDINGLEVVGADGSHVVIPGSVGPVLFKDFATERILLYLPFHGAKTGPFET